MIKDCIIYLIMAFLLAFTHTIYAGKPAKSSPGDASATTLESLGCTDGDIAYLNGTVWECQSFAELIGINTPTGNWSVFLEGSPTPVGSVKRVDLPFSTTVAAEFNLDLGTTPPNRKFIAALLPETDIVTDELTGYHIFKPGGAVFFESIDCSTMPYIPESQRIINTTGIIFNAAVIQQNGANKELYVAANPASITLAGTLTIQSARLSDYSCVDVTSTTSTSTSDPTYIDCIINEGLTGIPCDLTSASVSSEALSEIINGPMLEAVETSFSADSRFELVETIP